MRELAERELPVVAPLAQGGQTLHEFGGYRFAVYPKRGGRAPELEDRETLEWMGRFIGRIHAVGALAPFRARPALDLETFGTEPRDYLLDHGLHTSRSQRGMDQRCGAGAGRRKPLLRARRPGAKSKAARRLPRRQRTLDRQRSRRTARISSTSTTRAWDRRCRTCGCCSPASVPRWRASLPTCSPAMRISMNSMRANCTLSRHCARCASCITRPGSRGRWDDPAFPAAFPWFNTQRYWQDRILELREQIAFMDEPPLWSA